MHRRNQLVLASSIDARDAPLIPHFVRYYKMQGVREFLVLLRCDGSSCRDEAVAALAAEQITPIEAKGPASWVPNRQSELRRLVAERAGDGDWVIEVGPAELIAYDRLFRIPGGLHSLLRRHETEGHRFVVGRSIDMVAADGSFAPVRAGVRLWEQFPVACEVPAGILRRQLRRVIAWRGPDLAEARRAVRANLRPPVLRVHNFGWNATSIQTRINAAQRVADPFAVNVSVLRGLMERGGLDLSELRIVGHSGDLGGRAIPNELLKFMLVNVPLMSEVLEFGSGRGTQELSRFFKMHSIEHDETWVNRYASRYIHAPIEDGWYDVEAVRRGVEGLRPKAILVDGPPAQIGRSGFSLHLDLFDVSGWLIFDDINRPADLAHFETVCGRLPDRHVETFNAGEKTFGVIYPQGWQGSNGEGRSGV